jgi:hypothetical protein
LVTIYHLFLFTDFIPTGSTAKEGAGISIVCFICAQLILILLVLIIRSMGSGCSARGKKRYLARKYKITKEQVQLTKKSGPTKKKRRPILSDHALLNRITENQLQFSRNDGLKLAN